MSDNCQYQHLLIDHHIKMVFQKLQLQPKQSQIVKLPFTIYVQSKKIFKQDSQIVSYLIKRITDIFYLKEFKNEISICNDEKSLPYVNLLFSMKSNKIVILSQIMVRIVLLALSIQIGQKDSKTFKFKFSKLIQDLKIELILSPQSVSNIIIKELQFMTQCFQSLQYFDELKSTFQHLQVNKVVKWLQSCIKQKINNYQNKLLTILPYKLESNSKINTKETISFTQPTPSINTKMEVQLEATGTKGLSENKMDKKETRKNSSPTQRRISTIVLANRLRKSAGVPTTRFSSKYTFKSTKKQSQQSVVVYEQETELQCISIDKNYVCIEKKANMHNQMEYSKEQQDSNLILCPATPPKIRRKYALE